MTREELIKMMDCIDSDDENIHGYPACVTGHGIAADRILAAIAEEKATANADICPYCDCPIAIRNPTGKCDHLYYPDNVNKSLRAKEQAPVVSGLVEPLAVLADRKGFEWIWTRPLQTGYIIIIGKDMEGGVEENVNEAPTYAAAETAARAFLNGLPDKGGK